MRVLLVVCCALAVGVSVPIASATIPSSGASTSTVTCKTAAQKQTRQCRLIAKPTAKAPWKFSNPSLPLSASYDGKKLKVIATEKGACEEGELNFVDVTYQVNASIPVTKGAFDSDVTVTGSNGKKQILLLRGKLTKDALSIAISASFKDAATCIIGGNKNSVKRKL